jgi:hypothetical protein
VASPRAVNACSFCGGQGGDQTQARCPPIFVLCAGSASRAFAIERRAAHRLGGLRAALWASWLGVSHGAAPDCMAPGGGMPCSQIMSHEQFRCIVVQHECRPPGIHRSSSSNASITKAGVSCCCATTAGSTARKPGSPPGVGEQRPTVRSSPASCRAGNSGSTSSPVACASAPARRAAVTQRCGS